MRLLFFNLKLLFRLFQKSPRFALLSVFIVGLGIGASAIIFSIIDAALIHPFPYRNASGIVMIWEADQQGRVVRKPVSAFNFDALRTQGSAFSSLGAMRYARLSLTDSGQPEDVAGTITTASLFDVAEAKPLLGRSLVASDDGGPRVVVLSEGLWRRRFGADRGIVGRQIRINSESVTVVGVMAPEFRLPQNTQAWLSSKWKIPEPPLNSSQDPALNRELHYLRVIARLRPDVTQSQAAAELEKIATALQRDYSKGDESLRFRLVSLRDEIFGNVKPALYSLAGAVAFVLLIVCANMCNLMLARAANRKRETAIHLALGSPRSRLLFRFLSESIGIAILGGILGLFVASLGVGPLLKLDPRLIQSMGVPQLFNAHVLAFVLLLSVVSGLVFGVLPGLQFSKISINCMLREFTGTATATRSHAHIRNALMISQIAISLALLVCAGLLVNSFVRLMRIDPGFSSDHLLTLSVSLPATRYPNQTARAFFYDKALAFLQQTPGVTSAAGVTDIALRGDTSSRIVALPGQPDTRTSVNDHVCSAGYFATMRIPLLMGREFDSTDSADRPAVAIINESLAKRIWRQENPIGRQLQVNSNGESVMVVGVVGDVKQLRLEEQSQPQLYTPYSQTAWPFLTFVVRTQIKPEEVAGAGLQAIWRVDPVQPVSDVSTMDQIISASVRQRRFLMVVLTLFSGLSLVLAAVGLFAVVSYSVAQRTTEIGVRMALGADRGRVLLLFLKQATILTGSGLVIGVILSLLITRILREFLFTISATDPITIIGVSVLFLIVSLAASYVPAVRAARVDPLIALRQE